MYKDGVGRKWDGGSGISLESRLFFRSGLKVVLLVLIFCTFTSTRVIVYIGKAGVKVDGLHKKLICTLSVCQSRNLTTAFLLHS